MRKVGESFPDPPPHNVKKNYITQPLKSNCNTSSQTQPHTMTKAYSESVVPFGGSAPRVEKPNKDILGGKGLGLQEMSSIGIDVPPGFTLITSLCQVFDEHGDLPADLWALVDQAVARVEQDMGRKFGDTSGAQPLLFSCRSGAKISMPGMMDTVLNVGLNKETVEGMAKATGNRRFAFDAYRRLLDMFGDVVLGIPHEAFEDQLEALKSKAGVSVDTDLSASQLEELCGMYYKVYQAYGKEFPQDAKAQLRACIKAVFGSWNSERAIKYREINNITNLLGTACNIQTMVFGNLGNGSGTGVAFSRDPGTGVKELRGEYLVNAQGEDVVAGIRTPEHITVMEKSFPPAYKKFLENVDKLENHFKDMQDVEFTVEDGKLWMLQCRSGKRTGKAALQIACDLVNEGLCTTDEALLKVEPDHIGQVLHPDFDAADLKSALYKDNVVAVGLAGGPGAAVGKICFTTTAAEEMAAAGEEVILVRENTSPEDVGGMWASQGILTSRGGVTSHAAVVARGWGKPCVVGCDELEISEKNKTLIIKSTGEKFQEGHVISINGSTGEVIRVAIKTTIPSLEGTFGTLLKWSDDVKDTLKVLANADSGPDARKARELGAKGIGLCRTEHMFFAPERLPVVRRWILRGEDIDRVQDFQRTDFRDIFKEMDGLPVTIRLLDPPLHEFLPKPDEVTDEFAKTLNYDDAMSLKNDIANMHEENPMLGLRGCRLGITRPELTQMQAEAIINAAADCMEKDPKAKPFPRIMVPLVGNLVEFKHQALIIKRAAEKIKADRKINVLYEIGTMIEVPRAALISDQLAAATDPEDGKPLCSFFSYGTNDLTQMTMGISRDDAGGFIPHYKHMGVFEEDPFKSIDVGGVGWLVRLSAAKGRSVNPNLSLSVCGEHGGDPTSITFFDEIGLNYVSCSPFRVPVARLATGQASIKRQLAAKAPSKEERVIANNPLKA
uniref:Pyruvate, phosphate dikinase n=1 Tax=Amphora coffeiformis TaxID=265554 RepID=A0A7S3P7Y3_9STRA